MGTTGGRGADASIGIIGEPTVARVVAVRLRGDRVAP
jgi:hypothetical protein